MVVVIQEIKLHIIRRNDFRYVIQADLTNDIWNYADTRFLIKTIMKGHLAFLIIYQIIINIMLQLYFYQIHLKTELMFLRKPANVVLNISCSY